MIQLSIGKLEKLPKRLLQIFVIILALNILAITIGTVTGHGSMKGLLHLLRFDNDNNLGVFFSTVNLVTASLLLFIIYKSHKDRSLNDRRKWLVLSIIFLYLSIDECATIHETIFGPLESFLNLEHWFYWSWVIPGMIICAIVGLYFLRFYLNLPRKYKALFGISAFIFIGGAMGMETFCGYEYSYNQISLTYSILSTIEESMEMLGIVLFIYSLINYLKSDMPTGELITFK